MMVSARAFLILLSLWLSLGVSTLVSGIELDLSGGGWKATSDSLQQIHNVAHIDAAVPGSMYMDLLSNGLIADPYERFNDMHYVKYSYSSWNYTKDFAASAEMVNKPSIHVICDGVDTYSTVYLNGHKIGETTNQFVQYKFPVTSLLQLKNTLEFVFASPVQTSERLSKSYPYTVPPECPPDAQHGICYVNFIRKEQASFSWDWGPAFPTVGIWKDVRIQALDDASLTSFSAEVIRQDDGDWSVIVDAYLDGVSTISGTQNYLFVVDLVGTGINKTMDITLHKTASPIIQATMVVPHEVVDLWWPNGYGSQPLYTLSVSLSSFQPKWVSKQIGFRTVQLVQEPIDGAEGLSFYFKINDKPIFMKGSNWIPADSFQSRVTSARLEDLLGSARTANMNMLRVWGGGIYEQEEFYNLADKMGIMVWQDFMFACAMYPTNDDFIFNVTVEITQQIRRLKHHPSLAVWAGNNENEAALSQNWYKTDSNKALYMKDYVQLYVHTIKPIVEREHTSGIFVTSSPSNGEETAKEDWIAKNPYDTLYGDVHYYNYDAGRYFNDDYPRSRFMSEYGYQSWPSFDQLKSLTVAEDWNETSKFALNRNHHTGGQQQMNSQIQYYFNQPNSTSDVALNFTYYIYLTQVNQAMYIRMVSEFCRRSQNNLYGSDGHTMGALYWQLNDIWPGPSWSSLNYDGSWKMLHYYAKKFFAPNMISMAIEAKNLTVYSVIDDAKFPSTSLLTIYCHSWDSLSPKSKFPSAVKVLPSAVSTRLFNENMAAVLERLNCTDRNKHFLSASLDQTLQSELPLSPYKSAIGLSHAKIKVTKIFSADDADDADGAFRMSLLTDAVAPFVWLTSPVRGTFSDNGFLMKEQRVDVTFLTKDKSVTAHEFLSSLSIISLMDLYKV